MGKTLYELAKEAQNQYEHAIILAKVNGRLEELSDKEITDQQVEFITIGSNIGNETYRRSVILLMLQAIYKVAPKDSVKRVGVQYSISKGFYWI